MEFICFIILLANRFSVIIVYMSIRDFTILAKLGIFIIIKDKELTLPSTKFKDLQMVSLMLSKKSNLAISQIKKQKMHSTKLGFSHPSDTKT